MHVKTLLDRYLGMITEVGKLKNRVFKYFKDRVWKFIQGWTKKKNSIGGKEVLIKSVAQAIPAYAICVFKLPASVCDELTKLMKQDGLAELG